MPPLDSDAMQPTPHKVHLRGLDNLTSSDIEAFTSQHFNGATFDRIEWIDDTSANIVYATPALALEALAAFTDAAPSGIPQVALLQTFPAKSTPAYPEMRLHARLAVLGDRKQAGARERSRFYLFNPDHDPAERRRKDRYGRRGDRRYRDRDEGYYRGREKGEPFDASLYDDDEITRAVRASKSHGTKDAKSSISSGEYRGKGICKVQSTGRAVKELFPDRIARRRRDGGRLRDRSASPSRDSDSSQNMDISKPEQFNSHPRSAEVSGSANRFQAQMIKARLKEAGIEPKELFPNKSSTNHRRSDAVDATDAAADLFAAKMPVPFLDGSSEFSPRKRDLMSRITKAKPEDHIFPGNASNPKGFSIRGTARQQHDIGISIKGMASLSEPSVKELFPHKTGLNAGKELFSEKLEGRGGRRQRAEDMFY